LGDPKQLSTSRRTVIEGAAVTDHRRSIRIRRPAALHRLEGGIMRAARFYDRQDIRIEDIPEPDLLPGTVAIDVAWCGICGTDLQFGQTAVVEPYIIADDVDTSIGQSYQLSKDMNFIGLGGRGGGLAEKIVVQRRWVHPIEGVPLDQAALIEPLSVAHHAYV